MAAWGFTLLAILIVFPFTIYIFVEPAKDSYFYTFFIPVFATALTGASLLILIDGLLTKFLGKKVTSFYVERTYPKKLQKYIYDTIKNPYRWTDAHPWKKGGWKPYCVEMKRKVEGKFGRKVTILDKVTDLGEIYVSGPQLCLWQEGNMYSVRNLDKITDKRDILEFTVIDKGPKYPYDSEKIVYQIGEFMEDEKEVLKVGVCGVATINSRLQHLFKRPRHREMEEEILDYIYLFDEKPRYSDG